MPNPFKRHSRSRTRKRRAHDFLESPSLSKCSNCGGAKPPHIVCPSCGFYKGKRVLTVENI
jgi:large subunit ribosomal protein L32